MRIRTHKFTPLTVRFVNKASSAQKKISDEQAAFYSTMTSDFNQMFAKNNAITDSLTKSWQPILDAGINQFGFSKEEETALRTQASDSTAANYAAASKAVGQQLASRGGGNVLIPSGAEAAITGSLAGQAAESESQKQLGITTTGYDIGRSNYLAAASALGGVAGLTNPLGYAGAANSAGDSAFKSATTIYNQGGGFLSSLGGILGGVAGSFLGPIGASMGSKVGSMLGGIGGGSGNPNSPSMTGVGGDGTGWYD